MRKLSNVADKHNAAIRFAPEDFQSALLTWYDAARRELPWRANPGAAPDPYRVWLSEVMLQQTTVKAVIPYFEAFVSRWPTVQALAAAPRDEVLAAWAGLGYYSRARNLHACAQAVAEGGFPAEEAALRSLPGIGAYTAGAIAAIAFDLPAAAVDGNAERVIARLSALAEPLPSAKPRLRALAASLVPNRRPGDYAQALMDLGATVCTPRTPSCQACPVGSYCAACAEGEPERYPVKPRKTARPTRHGDAFVVVSGRTGATHILLRRRPDKGLLGGMMEVPCTEWVERGEAGVPSPRIGARADGAAYLHALSPGDARIRRPPRQGCGRSRGIRRAMGTAGGASALCLADRHEKSRRRPASRRWGWNCSAIASPEGAKKQRQGFQTSFPQRRSARFGRVMLLRSMLPLVSNCRNRSGCVLPGQADGTMPAARTLSGGTATE